MAKRITRKERKLQRARELHKAKWAGKGSNTITLIGSNGQLSQIPRGNIPQGFDSYFTL